MPTHPVANRFCHLLLASIVLCATPMPVCALDPRFELDPTVLGGKQAARTSPAPTAPQRDAGARQKMTQYTLKPGDHLYKVLSREYGTTGGRADALVAKIKQLNHISDIRSLQPGSTLLVPVPRGTANHRSARKRTATTGRTGRADNAAVRAQAPDYGVKPAMTALRGDAGAMTGVRQLWNGLVSPIATRGSDRFDYRSKDFSLSLDPERYPILPAQDGASILVDGDGTLPPLVKALIQERNPQIRVVSEDPASPRRFYHALLAAAQFYSFEEDFSVDFGSDPKITVRADFKIEKSPDSLLRQDVTLLNVSEGRPGMPDGLVRLLAGNGFRILETGAAGYQRASYNADLLYQVVEKEPKKVLDSFLDALALPFETGKSIDLYARDNIGVRLDVPVDRYFEHDGQRYVVALFTGDPVSYTLTRLLETKGYRVIMLQEGDDLRSISDKVLSRLHLPGRYGEHDLWPVRGVGYGVRISGTLIRDDRNGDRSLFVTDRNLDPLVKELMELNGYRLLGGR